MRECDVRTPKDALDYIVDCTLATVSSMGMKKSRPKYEYKRQIVIAQKGLDWMIAMKVPLDNNRAKEIVDKFEGSVEAWAKKYEV